MAQRLKRLPAMQETWVQSLGWEDPLEKEMATHSSTLAWRIPWMEEPGGLQSMGLQRVGHTTERLHCPCPLSCCDLACMHACCGTSGKESTCQCRRRKRLGFDPGLERSPGEGNGNPLDYFAWEIPSTEETGGPQSMEWQRVGHD